MDWLVLIAGMVIGILVYEFFKHFVIKKMGRLVILLVVVLVIFVVFSAIFANNESFKDNSLIKTGAAVAGVFTKGTEDVKKAGLSESSVMFNSTFKKE